MPDNNTLVVKDKVQRFARQFFNVVNLDDNGDLSIPYESTNLHVSVISTAGNNPEFDEFRKQNDISSTIVSVWATVLVGVKESNELYKWISIEGQGWDYGSFKVVSNDAGTLNVIFQYNLPGDNLDAGELKNALASVAFSADNNDDDLKARFGGKTVSDLRNSN